SSFAAGGGSDAIDQILTKVEQVRQAALAPLRSQEAGGAKHLAAHCGVTCLRVMTNTGNLRAQLHPPCGGPADPRLLFTYNSELAGTTAEFGNGWNNNFKRSATEVSSTAANGKTGTGITYSYTSKDATTGYYTPPGEAKNSLKQEANGTFTETQPDGTGYRYDTTGKLQYVSNPAGGRWSLSYSGSSIRNITDPFGRRTSLV